MDQQQIQVLSGQMFPQVFDRKIRRHNLETTWLLNNTRFTYEDP